MIHFFIFILMPFSPRPRYSICSSNCAVTAVVVYVYPENVLDDWKMTRTVRSRLVVLVIALIMINHLADPLGRPENIVSDFEMKKRINSITHTDLSLKKENSLFSIENYSCSFLATERNEVPLPLILFFFPSMPLSSSPLGILIAIN
jgi:hypothetical protein